MLSSLQRFAKNFPTLLLAFTLSVTVWISAVTEADPTVERVYPRPIPLEIVGQDPNLLMVNTIPSQVNLTLSAPRSIWERMTNEQIPVRAVADLSGLAAGTHDLDVQVQVGIRPVQIVSYTPSKISLVLEELTSKSFPVHLVEQGDVAVGFRAETPKLNQTTVLVSGAESLVNRVQEVRALLDTSQAKENINRAVPLQALDSTGQVVQGVTISPDQVTVSMPITQMGGYRNVVVKVITSGQIAGGYRVTNISVYPPAVTVFSNDPKLVDALPGYVDTSIVDINNANDDITKNLPLNLPPGVSVVGEPTVEVQVGIAPIEGSLTLSNMPVEIIGLKNNLTATVSPQRVDVILSGPLPLLDQLKTDEVHVIVDLSNDEPGTYQRVPQVQMSIPQLRVESIVPGTLEVTIQTKPFGTLPITPTVIPGITVTPVITLTVTPTR